MAESEFQELQALTTIAIAQGDITEAKAALRAMKDFLARAESDLAKLIRWKGGGHTPAPWTVNRAVFDDATGDVAYILEGVKEAHIPDARLIQRAPDLLAVARSVDALQILNPDGEVHQALIDTIAKAEGRE